MNNYITKMLIDEQPLTVSPSLARAIGLSNALTLQQIHYWCKMTRNTINGRKWVYNTMEEWSHQLPFSRRQIARIIASLEHMGLLIVGCFNKKSFDKTLWYTINYEKLDQLIENLTIIETSKTRKNLQAETRKNTRKKSAPLANPIMPLCHDRHAILSSSHHAILSSSQHDKMACPIPENTRDKPEQTTDSFRVDFKTHKQPRKLSQDIQSEINRILKRDSTHATN